MKSETVKQNVWFLLHIHIHSPVCQTQRMINNGRRAITVYSETLSAFTIDLGDSRSTGPDLLVSYHDNDHYNSVRNKLHPPKPSLVKPPLQYGKMDRRITNNDHINTGLSEIENVTTSLSTSLISNGAPEKCEIAIQKNIKRSAPCPCGSGLRYKKCCLAKKKHATRMERVKTQKQVEDEDQSETNENRRSPEMFRIVTI